MRWLSLQRLCGKSKAELLKIYYAYIISKYLFGTNKIAEV